MLVVLAVVGITAFLVRGLERHCSQFRDEGEYLAEVEIAAQGAVRLSRAIRIRDEDYRKLIRKGFKPAVNLGEE